MLALSNTTVDILLVLAVVAFAVETVLILLGKATGWLIAAGLACFAASFLNLK